MDLLPIKQPICSALHHEKYSRGLRSIVVAVQELTDFLVFLDDIVEEQFLHAPKDLPYQYGVRKSISGEYRAALIDIASWNICVLYIAKIHDYLWVTQRNHQSAREAFREYKDYIAIAAKNRELFVALYRMIDIGERIDIEHKSEMLSNTWLYLYGVSSCDERYRLLNCAFDYKLDIGSKLTEMIKQELTACKESGNVNLVDSYVALFEKIYPVESLAAGKRAAKQDQQLLDVRRQLVDALVLSARVQDGSLVHAIHMYEKAVLTLKSIPHTEDERKWLRSEMAEKQKQLLSQMIEHQHEMDVSVPLHHMYEMMDSLSKEECLNYLARLLPLFDLDKFVRRLEQGEGASLVDFFPAHIVDSEGRTTAVLPPIGMERKSDAIEAHAIRDTVMQAEINGFFIAHILSYLENKHPISVDDVQQIVDHSAFISPDRKKLYEKGLHAGFQKDFMTALNILIPQMEHSIRRLLQDSGVIVYNLKEDGTEEAKTLNGLLELVEAKDIFEADLLFTLQAVFCSKYGMNLRNENAHGLLKETFYGSPKAYFAWWLIFRLCYLLNARVSRRYADKVTERLMELDRLCNETDNQEDKSDKE